MAYSSEGCENVNEDGEGFGAEKTKHIDQISQLALDLYVHLRRVQNEHGMTSNDVQNRINALGRVQPSFGTSKRWEQTVRRVRRLLEEKQETLRFLIRRVPMIVET